MRRLVGTKHRSNSRDTHLLQHMHEDHNHALIQERDAQIAALEKEVTKLTNQLQSLSKEHSRALQLQQQTTTTTKIRHRHHPLTPYGNLVQETTSKCGGAKKRQVVQNLRARMGRNASVATAAVLNSLPDEDRAEASNIALAQRIVDMFKDPAAHMQYLNSHQFARDLLKLNAKVRPMVESEPRVAFLQSPAYVFGDIHGNLEDLHFFSDNIWRLGMSLTAGNFVFLGDYVDRGMSCLEVVAYLFAMKLLLPQKVFLLRGNHETRDVNGWEEHYGERSFIYQCRNRFGDDIGFRVWEQTNQVFDRLPLAAVIDQDIFCVHGGIPRPLSSSPSSSSSLEEGSEEEEQQQPSSQSGSRIQDILSVPRVAGINPPYEHEDDNYQQVASDCIWSDPASDDQESHGVDPHTGFGESLRGGGAICFGHKAVSDFLSQQGFSYIMRAHEAHAEGVAVSKGARVFTVFSTSKDHNQGAKAMAGCILVDFEKMQVINRSPAYRNQYVHRRDSVSLAMLSESEIKERIKLGLITTEPGDSTAATMTTATTAAIMTRDEEELEDYDEWDDFVEDDGNVDNDNNQQNENNNNNEGGDEPDDNDDDDEEEEEEDDDSDEEDDSDEDAEQYIIDTNRKSFVDPSNTVASPPGSTHDNHMWDSGDDDDDDDESSNDGSSSSSSGFVGLAHSSSTRKMKREIRRLSSIGELGEEDETIDSKMEDVEEEEEKDENVDDNAAGPNKNILLRGKGMRGLLTS